MFARKILIGTFTNYVAGGFAKYLVYNQVELVSMYFYLKRLKGEENNQWLIICRTQTSSVLVSVLSINNKYLGWIFFGECAHTSDIPSDCLKIFLFLLESFSCLFFPPQFFAVNAATARYILASFQNPFILRQRAYSRSQGWVWIGSDRYTILLQFFCGDSIFKYIHTLRYLYKSWFVIEKKIELDWVKQKPQ